MPESVAGNMRKDVLTGIVIICLLFGISLYLPIVGFFFRLLIPIPVLYYRVKLGRQSGLIVAAGATLFMATATGGLSLELLFDGELLLLGFLIGELFERNLNIEKTIAYAAGGVLLSGFAGLAFYGNMVNAGIAGIVSAHIKESLDMTMAVYEEMGLPEESLYRLSKSLDAISYILVRIIPSLAAASTLILSWATVLLARPVFKAKSLYYPEFGPINRWKAPEILVWGVIGCGTMLFLPGKGLKLAGLNGLLFFLTVYFFQGMAILSYFFEKKRFPLVARGLIYSFIALQQLVLLVVVLLGFFDVWFNFRRLEVQKKGPIS